MHQDSNAKFPEALRPAAGTRCFVSLGGGYDYNWVLWSVSKIRTELGLNADVEVLPTSYFLLTIYFVLLATHYLSSLGSPGLSWGPPGTRSPGLSWGRSPEALPGSPGFSWGLIA